MRRQKSLFKNTQDTSYGGQLLKTRKGRLRGRPLAVRKSMHLVLRSSKAKGSWSFRLPTQKPKIDGILKKFSSRYGVRLLSRANVGNHLHLHIQLSHRRNYYPFIRAITSAIAMAVTGASRWRPLSELTEGKFWDYRPFTRVVQGFKDKIGLEEYIRINQLEGCGFSRSQAKYILAKQWKARAP